MKSLWRVLLICTLSFYIMACTSINNSVNAIFGDDETSSEDPSKQSVELSELERAEQARLLNGRSNRPSLASLNLMPQGRDEETLNTSDLNASQSNNAASAEQIPQLSLIEKRNEYQALLPLITDEKQRRQVAFRLADINMLLAEQDLEQGEQIASDAKAGPFEQAISGYAEVLAAHQVKTPTAQPLTQEEQALNRKQMDAMYQLSRAYDLAGKKEQSVSLAKEYLATFSVAEFGLNEQHIELYFRIGEYYFNRQQYEDAAQYYAQVLSATNTGQLQNSADFYGISAYMLGWSEFKQDDYALALDAFDQMLRHTLGESNRLESMQLGDFDALSKGEMRLVADSIRVMALTFSYQGSGEAIEAFYAERANSPYQHLVYEELAQQYLDEDRFGDSADALLVFANSQPFHPRAVEFYVRHIDAYILGGFPEQVLTAKQGFVSTYSLGGEVLKRLDSPVGDAALPYLKTYLSELAQTEHSLAQSIDAILFARAEEQSNASNAQNSFAQGFNSSELSAQQSLALRSISDSDLATLRVEAYEQAISYYENYIRTFTYGGGRAEPEVGERRFYAAEAYMALERYEPAILAFETYAYQDAVNPMAVEAAYAALLAHAELDKTKTDLEQSSANDELSAQPERALLSDAQFSQQRFVVNFTDDPRTPVIVLNLMQDLFNDGYYTQAQRWALWILEPEESVHSSVAKHKRSAMLVMAHSEFELGQFASAESYYRRLLQISATSQESAQMASLNTSSQTDALIDRLAASLYKQAEQILSAINLTPAQLAEQSDVYNLPLSEVKRESILSAIGFWQTIISDTPSSSFRVAAQFDSASYYALIGQWDKAIALWLDFAERYPNDPLSASIDGQLLYAYQQTENWQAAADILLAQSLVSSNDAQGYSNAQDALYQAAVFYDKAQNREMALDSFRKYAHAYPEPLDMANEARYRMSQFYEESGEDSKRRYWLGKMLNAQTALAKQSGIATSEAGTPRSRYLAAMSAMVFASDADAAYTNIKLNLPLDKSLAKKQSALNKAIEAYDQVMGFAVAQYVSEANYHLANLYLTLAEDLMASSRPSGLSPLELSQYELLLEEQAFPFEETAIQLHENNAVRAQNGLYDRYVKQSFKQLSQSLPARYGKQELSIGVKISDL